MPDVLTAADIARATAAQCRCRDHDLLSDEEEAHIAVPGHVGLADVDAERTRQVGEPLTAVGLELDPARLEHRYGHWRFMAEDPCSECGGSGQVSWRAFHVEPCSSCDGSGVWVADADGDWPYTWTGEPGGCAWTFAYTREVGV